MSMHYIKTDVNGNIIKGFSSDFESPISGDILIRENGGRHFELFGVINPQLITNFGVYIYKYINSEVVKKTDEEITAETVIPTPQPSDIDLLKQELLDTKVALAELFEAINGGVV